MTALCQGHQLGIQDQLPRKRQRKKIPLRQEVAVVVEHNGRIAVRQRSLSGMLAGLWEFPSQSFSRPQSSHQLLHHARSLAGGDDLLLTPLGVVHHAYSHFRVEVSAFYLQVEAPLTHHFSSCRWLEDRELRQWPLHGSHKKIAEMLLTQRN